MCLDKNRLAGLVLYCLIFASPVLAAEDLASAISRANGSAKATNAAAEKVITWFQVDPSHSESLLWFEMFTRAYPRSLNDFDTVIKIVDTSPGHVQDEHGQRLLKYMKQQESVNDKASEVGSIIKAYGFPSKEFRQLWIEMVRELKATKE
ncbi:MAG: hypothetical protein ACE5E2_05670 [Candidatus Binatia bacterium]